MRISSCFAIRRCDNFSAALHKFYLLRRTIRVIIASVRPSIRPLIEHEDTEMTRPAPQNANQSPRPASPVHVKYLPPTIEEAVAAAQGLAEDDIDAQIEIAAGLMGVAEDDVREAVMAAAKIQQQTARGERVVVRDRAGSERAVVVQRAGRRQPMAQVTVERTRPVAGRLSLPGRVRVFDLTRSG